MEQIREKILSKKACTCYINVYVSVVRPVLEYACPVLHINLPQYLSDNIEVIQKRALKCIFLDWVTRRYLDVLTWIH